MIGNVREWVQDGWIENYTNAPSGAGARVGASAKRVVRGGSFSDGANNIRSASRTSLPAEYADTITGFRVVREVE